MENNLQIERNKKLLIEIENFRNKTQPLFLEEIKIIIVKINMINNGEFYKKYKTFLEHKLFLQKELDILKEEYKRKCDSYLTEHIIKAYELCIRNKELQIKTNLYK